MSVRDGIARAREELEAARLLSSSGFFGIAVSRAYEAAFRAAEAALLELGETRKKHSGVLAAFNQHVIKEQRGDVQAGILLRSLFTRRAVVDYTSAPVDAEEAALAIADAEAVVNSVETWLAGRS